MSAKDLFLRFVEEQRNANSIREQKGASHKDTVEAYERVNRLKRSILDRLEQLE